jgi:hypothetical protein
MGDCPHTGLPAETVHRLDLLAFTSTKWGCVRWEIPKSLLKDAEDTGTRQTSPMATIRNGELHIKIANCLDAAKYKALIFF